MNIIDERYQIAIDRIKEIKTEEVVDKQYIKYFCTVSQFILKLDKLNKDIKSNKLTDDTLEQLQSQNTELYQDIYPEKYEKSFANPSYAVNFLGQEFGQILCYLYKNIRDLIGNIYREETEIVTLWIELFIEIYNHFEEREELLCDNIREILYSFEKDNTEIFMEQKVDWAVNPEKRFAVDIVMNSDLSDIRYLYQYGEYVGDNEIQMAEYLNSMEQEKIDSAMRMLEDGDLPLEKVAMYSGLTLEQVLELEKELQPV